MQIEYEQDEAIIDRLLARWQILFRSDDVRGLSSVQSDVDMLAEVVRGMEGEEGGEIEDHVVSPMYRLSMGNQTQRVDCGGWMEEVNKESDEKTTKIKNIPIQPSPQQLSLSLLSNKHLPKSKEQANGRKLYAKGAATDRKHHAKTLFNTPNESQQMISMKNIKESKHSKWVKESDMLANKKVKNIKYLSNFTKGQNISHKHLHKPVSNILHQDSKSKIKQQVSRLIKPTSSLFTKKWAKSNSSSDMSKQKPKFNQPNNHLKTLMNWKLDELAPLQDDQCDTLFATYGKYSNTILTSLFWHIKPILLDKANLTFKYHCIVDNQRNFPICFQSPPQKDPSTPSSSHEFSFSTEKVKTKVKRCRKAPIIMTKNVLKF